MSSNPLIENLREIEHSLTADELTRACSLMRASGWRVGDDIPAMCWAMIYAQVLEKRADGRD